MSSLFTQDIQAPAPRLDRGIFDLRDYQAEDAEAVVTHWDAGRRRVLARQATGLGKSVIAAETARMMSKHGRVLMVVDVGSLAEDLQKTASAHTGRPQGSYTGKAKIGWGHLSPCPIVAATIQTLYAGREEPNYKKFDPREWSCIIVDECESVAAEKFAEVVGYFMDGNPDMKMLGLTATPYRGDGQGMGDHFDIYPTASTPCGVINRDIFWGYQEGWLVKPKQQFVQASIDLGSLKVRKRKGKEADYSDNDIANLMLDDDERQCREFAAACYGMAGDEPSIIICPRIDVAEAVAGYLDGAAGRDGYAYAVHGRQGGQQYDLIDQYKAGEYPCIVSVSMLFKGFDADRVKWVFMLRPTKSRRLVEQAAGRGTRPLKTIREALGRAGSAEERRKIIADSAKPSMTFVDVVGLDPDATNIGQIPDVTLTDIMLGAAKKKIPQDLIDRAKQNMAKQAGGDGLDVGDMTREARAEMVAEQEAEIERRREAAKLRAAVEKGARSAIHVDAELMVEDVGFGRGLAQSAPRAVKPHRGTVTDPQLGLLVALGMSGDKAMGVDKRQAGAIIDSYKKKGVQPDWRRVGPWEHESGIRLERKKKKVTA